MHTGKTYEIGRKYYQDEVDPEKALKWFHKAAYLGNTDAMLCIASCYLFGWGLPENKEQALAWFDMAYKLGGGRPNDKHCPGKIPTRGVYADRRD